MEHINRFSRMAIIAFCLCVFCALFAVEGAYALEAEEGVDSSQAIEVSAVKSDDAVQQDASDQLAVLDEDAEAQAAETVAGKDGETDVVTPQEEGIEVESAEVKSAEGEGAVVEGAEKATVAEEGASETALQNAEGVQLGTQEDPVVEQLLEEGDYVIKTGLGGKYVLDVDCASMASGANVQLYEYNATAAQKWHVSCDAAGYYLFKSLNSGLMLGVADATPAKGTNVVQKSASDDLSQRWVLVKSGGGFKVVSALDQAYVLDIAYAQAANNTNVQLFTSKDTAAQQFIFALLANAATTYDTPLASGDYVIQSALGAYALDVSGGSSAPGANVQLWEYNGTNAQKWHLDYDEKGLYTITNIGSGLPLDLSWAKAWYSQNVQQFRAKGTDAQKWAIVADGSKFKIASAVDPLFVLDVSWARAENGSNIQVYFDKGSSAQRFSFHSLSPAIPASDEVADGVYAIAASSDNNYVLDVAGGSLDNGANVQLYQSNDTNAQRWGIVRNEDGLYTLFSMGSGKSLDVAWGSLLDGANVQQYTGNDSKAAQKWAIVKNAVDSTFSLFSAVSGAALDISGAAIANGSNIQMYSPNGNANQRFSLIAKPLVEEGVYSVHPARNAGLAVDVPWGTPKDGTALQVFTSKDSPAQHVVVKAAEDGNVALQFVGSGKYIADEGGTIIQRVASGDASQRWAASLAKGGIVFTNAATGKAMGVADSSPSKGTKLVATDPGILNSRFCLRSTNLLADGLYTFATGLDSGRALDVAGGSWASGSNAQLFDGNGTNAQKFLVQKAGGDYYKVLMVFSGLALNVAGGSTASGANVDFSTWNGSDAQLWKPVVTDSGLSFVNKGSGLALDVAGAADKNGANIDQAASTGVAAQAWNLSPTKVNIGDMGSIEKLVRSVAGGSGIKASYSVPQGLWNNLVNAVSACWNNGRDIGFLMTDLQTGNWVSLNADKIFYSACTMKACYVTWLFQELLETGRTSWDHVADRLYPAIIESENSTYLSLRAEFGSDGVNNWLHGVGLAGWGDDAYTFYTPRELQLIWTRILAYEQSGGRFVNNWRGLFGSNHYSPIADELRWDHNAVYAKPGWYPLGSEYGTLSDGSIVECRDGRRYLLTVMSSVDPYGEYYLHTAVDRALDSIFQAIPGL